MQVDIKTANFILKPEIEAAIKKKIFTLNVFAPYIGDPFKAFLDLGIVSGLQDEDIFRAQIHVQVPEKTIYHEIRGADLISAIDQLRDGLERELIKHIEKLQTHAVESIKWHKVLHRLFPFAWFKK